MKGAVERLRDALADGRAQGPARGRREGFDDRKWESGEGTGGAVQLSEFSKVARMGVGSRSADYSNRAAMRE